jgi:Leucine-rich repeat (LRR) protein
MGSQYANTEAGNMDRQYANTEAGDMDRQYADTGMEGMGGQHSDSGEMNTRNQDKQSRKGWKATIIIELAVIFVLAFILVSLKTGILQIPGQKDTSVANGGGSGAEVTQTTEPASEPAQESVSTPDPGPVISISDPVLERQIRSRIRKGSGEIYLSDIQDLTSLNLSRVEGIRDYSSLADFPSLRELVVKECGLTDAGLFKDLKQINNLNLGYNNITDLSPLEGMSNIVSLYVNHNKIKDISPLLTMENLQNLYLGENLGIDISPLRNMTQLKGLTAGGCLLDDNDIKALAPLTGLKWLHIQDNQISDISPLKNMTGLTNLSLHNNRIKDITPLKNMTQLIELHLEVNRIADFSPIDGLPADAVITR